MPIIEPTNTPLLLPSGDSLQGSSSVSSLLASSSSETLSSTSTTTSSTQPAVAAAASTSAEVSGTYSEHTSPPVGLIIGMIILVLWIIGLTYFIVRKCYILKRGQKTSATRARLSRIAISEPTNFQHLGTGRVNVAAGAGGAAQISGFTISNHQAPSRETLPEEDMVYERVESPRERMKKKYSYDFGTLESGLSDHVETMRKNQKAPSRV